MAIIKPFKGIRPKKELVEKTYSTDSFFEPIKNIKTFAEKFYHVTVETSTTKKMDAIKNEILSGYPVLVSCGILRPYLSSEYVLPSKKKAYAKVFNRELSTVSASSYDNKLAEYINQINEEWLLESNGFDILNNTKTPPLRWSTPCRLRFFPARSQSAESALSPTV